MNQTTDILVIGSGPAGLAAALNARNKGLEVTIVESSPFPRYRAGESLHPGIEPVFKHLAVDHLLSTYPCQRYSGIFSGLQGQTAKLQKFGFDAQGEWLGYQILGETFDIDLQKTAIEKGARLYSDSAKALIENNNRMTGITTSNGNTICAKFVIDASGRKHWLARQLGLGIQSYSPRLYARCDYLNIADSQDAVQDEPLFEFDAAGWTYTAKISPQECCVTRLNWNGKANTEPRQFADKALTGLALSRTSKGADVTWRCVDKLAGPGYFIVGDAAMVLDPASSQGVIRALISGITASESAVQALEKPTESAQYATNYANSTLAQFHDSRRKLALIYQDAPCAPDWINDLSSKLLKFAETSARQSESG